MRRMFLGLAAAWILVLSGCGAPQLRREGLFYQAAGISPDQILLTVDGREVPAWRYLYWLTSVCDQLQAACTAAGRALDWQETLSGESLEAYARRQALESAALYAVVENWALDRSVTLTEADRAELEADYEAQCLRYGGETAYLAALEQMGLGREEAMALSEDAWRYRRLQDLSLQSGSDLYAGPAELEAFAAEETCLAAQVIRVDAGDTAAQEAQDLFTRLNTADDGAALFAQLAGDAGNLGSFRAGDGTLSREEEDALLALQPGQWSGVVETQTGLSLVLRLAPDEAALRQALLDRQLLEAVENARIQTEKTLEELPVAAFYDALARAREAAAA